MTKPSEPLAGSFEMEPKRVLVVDDDPGVRKALSVALEREGFMVSAVASGSEALTLLEVQKVDTILTDIQMPGLDGLDLLSIFRRRYPLVEVLVMTGYGTIERAIRAMKNGAYDFLTKPFDDLNAVLLVIDKAVEKARLRVRADRLQRELESRETYQEMVGSSLEMQRVYELIETISYSDAHVLVRGESGTGKELVARALHHRSPRSHSPFVVVNCSALTETLLESELFGHVKGAFTGAHQHKRGLFQAAHKGTLFLDEIGDISPRMQVKILRAVQEGEIRPVGSTDSFVVDVRVITATHRDLVERMKEGLFREDLYYRINVVEVNLPPLRERPRDIPLLAVHFLARLAKKLNKPIQEISAEALGLLTRYGWPGNVRELENVMERALILEKGEEIGAHSLPPKLHKEGSLSMAMNHGVHVGLEFKEAKKIAVGQFERAYVRAILERVEGNVAEASRVSGMDRSNFRRIMKKYGLGAAEE